MTAAYLQTVVAALDRLNAIAVNVENRLTARLEKDLPASVAVAAVADISRLRSWLQDRLVRPAGRFIARIKQARQAIRLIPAFAAQSRRLARVRPCPDHTTVVIGIASNRLTLDKAAANPREAITALFARIGGDPEPAIADAIRDAPHIVLCDALPLSALWSGRRGHAATGIFVVDAAFLLFESTARHLRAMDPVAAWRTVWRALTARRRSDPTESRRRSRAAAVAVWADAFDTILDRWPSVDAFFLTCHSLLTEILRARLIESSACRRILDVMHGVGSIPAEGLFATILDAAPSGGQSPKHAFIPQIPGLPLAGVFGRHASRDPDLAINAYLNSYFLRFENESVDFGEFLDAEYAALVGERTSDRAQPTIITILGFAPHRGQLLGSTAFAIECALIAHLGELRRRDNHDWILLYVPHPVHARERRWPATFTEYDVRVYPHSVMSWLLCDVCVSLMSSAMFEAAYFGARAFTPLVADDHIFTAAYLDLVAHPNGPHFRDCTSALSACMAEYTRPVDTDVLRRAHTRLTTMRARHKRQSSVRSGLHEQDRFGKDHRVLVS